MGGIRKAQRTPPSIEGQVTNVGPGQNWRRSFSVFFRAQFPPSIALPCAPRKAVCKHFLMTTHMMTASSTSLSDFRPPELNPRPQNVQGRQASKQASPPPTRPDGEARARRDGGRGPGGASPRPRRRRRACRVFGGRPARIRLCGRPWRRPRAWWYRCGSMAWPW
jgi:hypothetical protein